MRNQEKSSKSYEKEALYHEEKSDRDNCTISIEDPDIPGKRIMISILTNETGNQMKRVEQGYIRV